MSSLFNLPPSDEISQVQKTLIKCHRHHSPFDYSQSFGREVPPSLNTSKGPLVMVKHQVPEWSLAASSSPVSVRLQHLQLEIIPLVVQPASAPPLCIDDLALASQEVGKMQVVVPNP